MLPAEAEAEAAEVAEVAETEAEEAEACTAGLLPAQKNWESAMAHWV